MRVKKNWPVTQKLNIKCPVLSLLMDSGALLEEIGLIVDMILS